jgi:hypothetical protein
MKKCNQCDSSLEGYYFARKFCNDCVSDGDAKERKKWDNNIRNYGVDKRMFEAMYFEQDGQCLLCPAEARDVDHDHATGKVRGLLCNNCNTGLRHLERPGWLDRAIDYLADS